MKPLVEVIKEILDAECQNNIWHKNSCSKLCKFCDANDALASRLSDAVTNKE